jgi:hypothetical protein
LLFPTALPDKVEFLREIYTNKLELCLATVEQA